MAYGKIYADFLEDSNGDSKDLTAIVTNDASTGTKGYMSAADKTKLDAIEAGAEVNTVTSVNGSTGAVTVQGFSGDYDDLTNKPTLNEIDGEHELVNETVSLTGSNLILNGDWATLDSTNWTPGDAIVTEYYNMSGFQYIATRGAGGINGRYQAFTTTVGATYSVSIDTVNTGGAKIFDGTGSSGTELASFLSTDTGSSYVTSTITFTATSTTTTISLQVPVMGGSYGFGNVSITEQQSLPTLKIKSVTEGDTYASFSTTGVNVSGDFTINGSSIATVATSGDYDDLTNQPSALSISYPSGNTIDEVTGAGGGSLDETFDNSGNGYEIMVLDYGGGEYAVIIKLAGSTIDAVVPNSNNGSLNGTQVVTLTWNSGASTTSFIPDTSALAGSSYRFDMWTDPNANPSAADDEFVTVNISSPPPTYVFNNGAAAQTALVTSPSASGKIDIGGVQYTISDFTDETLANGKLTVQYASATTIAAGDSWREVPNTEPTEGLLSYADASRIATLPAVIPFFETGVWAPRCADYDGGNFSDFYSHSMTLATGKYQRIGKMVFCTFSLMHPASGFGYSNGSATDRVYMADLPYAVGSNGFASSVIAIYSNLPAGMTGIPAIRSNATQAEFVGLVDGNAATEYLDAQDLFQAQSVMQGSFTYITDDTTYTVHSTATADG
jgi:hypothetical protein